MKSEITPCLLIATMASLFFPGCIREKGNQRDLIRFDLSAFYPDNDPLAGRRLYKRDGEF
jgi:hypothetical protein